MGLCVPGDVLSSWSWLSTCDTTELSCCKMLSALWLLFQKRCFADAFLLPNFYTTLPPITQQKLLRSHSCLDMNLEPTLFWEKSSFQHWKIHDIFHTTLLTSYQETTTHGPNFFSLPPDLIGSEEEYEVECIVSERILSHHRPPGKCWYLTMWEGYPLLENTWEPKSNLNHAIQLLSKYKNSHHLSLLEHALHPPA